MDAEELRKCLDSHPKNKEQIGKDIGVTGATIGRWSREERKISESDVKLLRLYFYGEIPFEDIRPSQDLAHILKFSAPEWEVIKIIATRNGMTPGEWIAGQIRDYLAYRDTQAHNEGTKKPQGLRPYDMTTEPAVLN